MKQRELSILGNIKRPVTPVSMDLIRRCRERTDAIKLCVLLSDYKDTALARLLDIDKGNFSRMLSGQANFPPNKEELLQSLCGNEAILDYDIWIHGRKSVPMSGEEIAELEQFLLARSA